MRKILGLRILAFAVLLALAGSLVVGSPAGATHTTETVYSVNGVVRQKAFSGTRIQVNAEIAQEIGNLTAGDEIRASMYIWRDSSVHDAVKAAIGRGVEAEILVEAKRWNQHSDMRANLIELVNMSNQSNNGRVTLKLCWYGCEWGSPSQQPESSGILHDKFFWLKDRTGSGTANDDYVIVSSANLTNSTRYEAAMLINVDHYTTIRSELAARWNEMFWDVGTTVTANDTVDESDIDVTDQNSYLGYQSAYQSGEVGVIDPGGNGSTNNAWVNFINAVATQSGTDCEIRGVMGSFNNSSMAYQIIDALRRAEYRGCDVDIIFSDQGKNSSGVPYYEGLITRAKSTANPGSEKPIEIELNWRAGNAHAKFLAIQGRWGGSSVTEERVWVGSANFTNNALRYNDELLARSTVGVIYDHYVHFFSHLETAEQSSIGCQQADDWDHVITNGSGTIIGLSDDATDTVPRCPYIP